MDAQQLEEGQEVLIATGPTVDATGAIQDTGAGVGMIQNVVSLEEVSKTVSIESLLREQVWL